MKTVGIKSGNHRGRWHYLWHLIRRNPLFISGLVVIAALLVAALFAPYITPYPQDAKHGINFAHKLKPPSLQHLFGTDALGRDIFTRVVFGAGMSLKIGLTVILFSLAIGVPLGLIAGFFGGKIDEIIMRLTDMFLAFPPMLLPLAIAAALGASIINAMIAISASWFPWYVRLIRAQVLTVKEELYVESARSIGVSHPVIIYRHILPNVLSPVVIQASMDMGYAILLAASLSFIGVGAKPPTVEWGLMITSARVYFLDYWWTVTFPGLAIFISVLAFNLVGDGLRDILDPKIRD
ncbi:MAG: ABC transporter permease [Desulfobacterales bacterium]|jgi:peptide/nickel transport system permease protein